jgi:hypothetical protein
MFYKLVYTLNGIRIVEDVLTTALLADKLAELSREHDRGEGHYVCIESVTPLTASLSLFA